MRKSKKIEKPKNIPREMFSYLLEKSKETVARGGSLKSSVYVIGNEKGCDKKIWNIDLSTTSNSEERQALLKAISFILSKEEVEVDMFISIFEGMASEVKDDIKTEVLCAGAIDLHGNNADVMFDIERGHGGVTLSPHKSKIGFDKNGNIKWAETKKSKLKNNLLLTMYKSYRGL